MNPYRTAIPPAPPTRWGATWLLKLILRRSWREQTKSRSSFSLPPVSDETRYTLAIRALDRASRRSFTALIFFYLGGLLLDLVTWSWRRAWYEQQAARRRENRERLSISIFWPELAIRLGEPPYDVTGFSTACGNAPHAEGSANTALGTGSRAEGAYALAGPGWATREER